MTVRAKEGMVREVLIIEQRNPILMVVENVAEMTLDVETIVADPDIIEMDVDHVAVVHMHGIEATMAVVKEAAMTAGTEVAMTAGIAIDDEKEVPAHAMSLTNTNDAANEMMSDDDTLGTAIETVRMIVPMIEAIVGGRDLGTTTADANKNACIMRLVFPL